MIVESVPYHTAIVAGLLSFFSPCILPLLPGYFTFITGYSLEELTHADSSGIRYKVILSTLAYVLGFSTVFILLGASASLIGQLVLTHANVIRVVGGVLIIVLGIHMTGWLRIPGLDFEKRVHFQKKPLHFLGTFVVGMAFGAGWSPCIGPLLGSILIIASNQETLLSGMLLLGVYSVGLAIPFVVISVFIHYILKIIPKISAATRYINLVAGILLIGVGLTLAMGWL